MTDTVKDKPERVLIVSDDIPSIGDLADELSSRGFNNRVIPSTDLSQLKDFHVECVLVNVGQVSIESVDLVKKIRVDYPLPNLPVIILSDEKTKDRASDVLRAGATAELCFPWNAERLITILEIQLNLRKAYIDMEQKLVENEKAHQQLQNDLALSQQVQQSFLPPNQLRTGNFHLEARLFAGGDLSGDYFDYALLTPQRLVLFLADVSGHGIASALLANRLKAFFDENTRSAHRPRLFLERLNRVILDLGEHYHIATAVCVHIDIAESVITYASAGHRTMYWLDTEDYRHVEMPATGPALGMFKEFEINEINRGFMPGRNRLVVYTDGLVEFKLPDNRWITEESFRDEVMIPNGNLPVKEYVHALLDASHELTGKNTWDDDVTLLVVDY